MTSITLIHPHAKHQADHLIAVLANMGTTCQRLVVGLWVTLTHRSMPTLSAPTRHEEAEALRNMALRLNRHDPQFLQDLFAAADRHEWGENAY